LPVSLTLRRPFQPPPQPPPRSQGLAALDLTKLTPLTPEVISRQATINVGTIGHVAHGKSTVVKAISGVKVSGRVNDESAPWATQRHDLRPASARCSAFTRVLADSFVAAPTVAPGASTLCWQERRLDERSRARQSDLRTFSRQP
jgi:hypothetical protein